METTKKEYQTEYINCIIPKQGKQDFIVSELHIKVQELQDVFTKHKKFIESNNGFFSVTLCKSFKDPNKLYLKHSQLVEVKEEVVTHKEQMPDRDDLPF